MIGFLAFLNEVMYTLIQNLVQSIVIASKSSHLLTANLYSGEI